jgi:uncharacterized protein (TIGR02265 family)
MALSSLEKFSEPPWAAPLDAGRVIAAISRDASIAGMFFLAVLSGAKRRGVGLTSPRDRYLPFGFYPLTEFAPLLVSAAERFYPDRSLRQGLRTIGASAPAAFATSVLGKVTLNSAEDVHSVVTAIATTYAINIPTSRCTIVESSSRMMVLALEGIQHFLDSHHVGVFEGTLRHAGVSGQVRIRSYGRTKAELLLEW